MDIALSPDGRTLATVGDGRLAFSSIDSGGRLGRPLEPELVPGSPAFGAQGRSLVTSLGDHELAAWDVQTRRLVARRKVDGIVGSVAASARFGPRRGERHRRGRGHRRSRDSLAARPEARQAPGRCLCSRRRLRLLARWQADRDRRSRRRAPLRHAHLAATRSRTQSVITEPVMRTVFNPDGHTLVTTGADGTARLWDVASQQVHWGRAPGRRRPAGRRGVRPRRHAPHHTLDVGPRFRLGAAPGGLAAQSMCDRRSRPDPCRRL